MNKNWKRNTTLYNSSWILWPQDSILLYNQSGKTNIRQNYHLICLSTLQRFKKISFELTFISMLGSERRKWGYGLQYQLPTTSRTGGWSKVILRRRDSLAVGRRSLNARAWRVVFSKDLRNVIVRDILALFLKLWLRSKNIWFSISLASI